MLLLLFFGEIKLFIKSTAAPIGLISPEISRSLGRDWFPLTEILNSDRLAYGYAAFGSSYRLVIGILSLYNL